MEACLDLWVLAGWLWCSCEVERLDKGVGVHVKGRGYRHVRVTVFFVPLP